MVSRVALCCVLAVLYDVAGTRISKDADKKTPPVMTEGLSLVEANSAAMVAIEPEKLTQLLTSAVGLLTSFMGAIDEDPPDWEYAFSALNLQGWKMVKIFVPKEEQKSDGFKGAHGAWKHAFGYAEENVGELVAAWEKNDMQAVSRSILGTCGAALQACGEAYPQDKHMFDAYDDLLKGIGHSIVDFLEALGVFDSKSALLQIEGQEAEKPKFSLMLNTGVGLITTLISAFTEDPPDIDYAFDTLQMQGWKLVKLIVPKEDQKAPEFRNAKKAWDRTFSSAADIVQDIMKGKEEGSMGRIIQAILNAVETGLKTAADVDKEHEKFLVALADFLMGIGGSSLSFSREVGWLS